MQTVYRYASGVANKLTGIAEISAEVNDIYLPLLRDADVRLMTTLRIGTIYDLMVEHQKVKVGDAAGEWKNMCSMLTRQLLCSLG